MFLLIPRQNGRCYVSQRVHRMIKRINGSAGLVSVFVSFPNIVSVLLYGFGAVFRDAHIVNLLYYANTKIDAVRTLDARLHVIAKLIDFCYAFRLGTISHNDS